MTYKCFNFSYKNGRGTKENSSNWTCVFDEENNLYYGETFLGNADGMFYTLYEINKEIYDTVGSFSNDDYKSQNLIKTGRLLYSLEDTNYGTPDHIEEVGDINYKQIHDKYFKHTVK